MCLIQPHPVIQRSPDAVENVEVLFASAGAAGSATGKIPAILQSMLASDSACMVLNGAKALGGRNTATQNIVHTF